MKISFAVILFFLSSVVAFAQSQPSVYQNNEFHIRFVVPQGWTIADEAAKETHAKASQMDKSQHLLLLLTRKKGEAPTERITVVAQQFPQNTLPANDAPARYVDNWAEAHSNLERDTAKKRYPSSPAAEARFKAKSGPERWFELYATMHGQNFFRVLAEFNTEAGLDEWESSGAGFALKPDWESPDEKVSPAISSYQGGVTKTLSSVRISQGVSQGLLQKKVQPKYPHDARSARVQGSVVLRALINARGKIVELTVVAGHPMLVPAAIEAVHQWEYKPYVLNGEPVNVETQITVAFTLQM